MIRRSPIARSPLVLAALAAAGLFGAGAAQAQSQREPSGERRAAPSSARPTAGTRAPDPRSGGTAAGRAATGRTATERAATDRAAGGAKELGKFGVWTAYVAEGGAKTCFALASPRERKPANLKTTPAYLFVSSIPGQQVREEVSVRMGVGVASHCEPGKAPTATVKCAKVEDVRLTVGTARFALAGKGETLFSANPAEEGQIVAAMRRGSEMTLAALSQRGNPITDAYSLSGFAQAIDRVRQECR